MFDIITSLCLLYVCDVMFVCVCLCVYNRLYWVGGRLVGPHHTISVKIFQFDFHCFYADVFYAFTCKPQTSPSAKICLFTYHLLMCLQVSLHVGTFVSKPAHTQFVSLFRICLTRIIVFLSAYFLLPILIQNHKHYYYFIVIIVLDRTMRNNRV